MFKKLLKKMIEDEVLATLVSMSFSKPSPIKFKFEEEKTKPTESCERCGGMFQEDKMKVVKRYGWFINPESFFYCSNCKPNYDRIDRTNGEKRYFKEVEVDEKGTIIGRK